MHTVLLLQLDRTVTAHFPEGPTGVPCYALLKQDAPCADCPIDTLTEAQPRRSLTQPTKNGTTHHHLQLVQATPTQPAHFIETITLTSTTNLLAPQDFYPRLHPLYLYAVEVRQPLSVLLIKYRQVSNDVPIHDLKTRFPRRFRDGALLGELPGRQLVWIDPHLSEGALSRLAIRIRKDFPDPHAYSIHVLHAIPPGPTDPSLGTTIHTFTAWLHTETRKALPAPATLLLPTVDLPPPTLPFPSTALPAPSIETSEESAPRAIPPLHEPTSQLDAMLAHLEQSGPALQQAVDRVRMLREHHAEAEALIFADLLQPLSHRQAHNGIVQTTTIRDAVQLMDVFAKEAGRLLLNLYDSGSLAQHGYATIGEFATAIGLHPETAGTLIQLATQRRPLIQTGYPDRLPSRPKPRPLGLILKPEQRQTDRRSQTRPISPDQNQRAINRRTPSLAHRTTEPPSPQAQVS